MNTPFHVDPDITIAATLPGAFYHDADAYELCRERLFARTWQWLGDLTDVAAAESLSPRELLPGLLNEPLLLAWLGLPWVADALQRSRRRHLYRGG